MQIFGISRQVIRFLIGAQIMQPRIDFSTLYQTVSSPQIPHLSSNCYQTTITYKFKSSVLHGSQFRFSQEQQSKQMGEVYQVMKFSLILIPLLQESSLLRCKTGNSGFLYLCTTDAHFIVMFHEFVNINPLSLEFHCLLDGMVCKQFG